MKRIKWVHSVSNKEALNTLEKNITPLDTIIKSKGDWITYYYS